MTVESKLEKLLEVGTWTSTLVVALGVIFSLTLIIKVGIGMFILIPIIRVFGLVINFYQKQDFKMFWIGVAVFAIIMVSLVVGMVSK